MPDILHENSFGVRIVRRDFRARSQVQVLKEEGKKKTVYQTYRFTRLSETFSSPFFSWANLDCCGLWDFDTAYLDTAVQEGRKLYAGRSQMFSENSDRLPTKAQLDEQFHQLVLPEGVIAGIEAGPGNGYNTYICRTGCIADHVSMDEVWTFYEKLGCSFPDSLKEQVEDYCHLELRAFGTGAVPFRYSNACTQAELITTGLLLGYPLESTSSLLQKN